MIHEKSCGALVVRRGKDGKRYILMIRQRRGGNRSFPKGHVEVGETELMTAEREVFEETSVRHARFYFSSWHSIFEQNVRRRVDLPSDV